MYKIFYPIDFENINWDSNTIDIALCDYPPLDKKNILFKIWKKAKQYPNKKINLYSSDGPLLVFFTNAPNIKWALNWEDSNSNMLWNAIKPVHIHTTLNHDKNIKFSVCSFNGSHNITRTASCVGLLNIGLWNPEVCTKNFVATHNDLKQFDNTFVKAITNTLDAQQLKNFLLSTNSTYTPFDFLSNIKKLNPLMQKAFINFVSESEAEADLPNVTEKVFLGIVSKTITVVVGQKYWNKVFFELYGFKKYNCFDYSFDCENKFELRLSNVLDQLKFFATLSTEEQQEIHNNNKEIINYNYEHFISGNWKKYCQQSLSRLDKLKPEPYNTIGE